MRTILASQKLSQIYFYLNEGHNLACRICWSRQRAAMGLSVESQRPTTGRLLFRPRQAEHLNPALFDQAIHEGLPLGLRTVTLTGGDPLLHPEFDSLLAMLENSSLKVYIETYGGGVTPELAQRLWRMDRANVAIGLDGVDAETHERLSGKPGTFETATQAARVFAKAGVKPQIVFSLVKDNAGQIGEMVQLAEQLGAWSVRFFLVHPPAGSQPPDQDGGQALEVEELIALGRRVERDLAPFTRLRLLYDQPPAFRGLNPQGPTEVQRRCSVLNAISVMPGGSYALCGAGSLAPELVFGQVGVNSLEQIWNEHPLLLQLRDGMPHRLSGVCERCIMKTTCQGNCIVQNYINTGSFWGPFWFCEAAERASLFPASRLRENSIR